MPDSFVQPVAPFSYTYTPKLPGGSQVASLVYRATVEELCDLCVLPGQLHLNILNTT